MEHGSDGGPWHVIRLAISNPKTPFQKVLVMKMRFLRSLRVLAAGVLLLTGTAANAVSVSYNLQFTGFFASYGSGMMTFVDTPSVPGTIVPGSTRYDLVDVMGTGALGPWTTSFFEYNPATGQSLWRFFMPPATGSSFPALPTGLSPVDAFEANLAGTAASGSLIWSRKAPSIPDVGSTLPLAAAGFMALLLAGRAFRRAERS